MSQRKHKVKRLFNILHGPIRKVWKPGIIIIIIHGLVKTFKLVAIGKITLNLQNLQIKQ